MTHKKLYIYSLDTSSNKNRCPSCNHTRFVRYINNAKQEPISDEVGRCDRENSCGYHMTPRDYFAENDYPDGSNISVRNEAKEIQPPTFIDDNYLIRSCEYGGITDFGIYLKALFREEVRKDVLNKYFIGSTHSEFSEDGKVIFWRVDINGNIRSGKIMQYSISTGKRDKNTSPGWVHTRFPPFNFQSCFFGEHLLTEFPDSPIAIVESEKTAIIASVLLPGYVWLATGGKAGMKWREYDYYKVLDSRNVMLFPDFGYSNNKGKTCYQDWCERAEIIQKGVSCRISVSRFLEEVYSSEDRTEGYDLADYFIEEAENNDERYRKLLF